MTSDGRDGLFIQVLAEEVGSFCFSDKDDDLVELQLIDQFEKSFDFFIFSDFQIILSKTMKSQFGFIVNKDLLLLLHELDTNLTYSLAHGGTEHHDLLVSGSLFEDVLHIASHVQLLQDFVALVEYKELEFIEFQVLPPN